MAVTISSQTWQNDTTLVVEYSTDGDGPFYIWRDGRFIATTYLETWTFHVASGEYPVLDIMDEDADPATAYPGKMLLFWWAGTVVDYYRVDEYVSEAWVERAKIYETSKPCYQWETRWLEDVTYHQFRIVPVRTNGNAGTATTRRFFMVRHPDTPAVTATWDSDNHLFAIAST